MKLIPKKGGNGYISSYTVNISLKIARNCGLVNEDGTINEIELTDNMNDNSVTIKLKKQEE